MLSRPRSLVLTLLVACVALGGSAACTAEGGEDDTSASSVDALSEKSNQIVLAVANNTPEDTLDLDVGLSAGAARRIVNARPFATITALRAVVTTPELKLLLLYGQSQPMYGDAGPYSDAGPYGDASPYSDGGADAYSDAGHYSDARADAYSDGGADAYPDAHSYSDGGADAH